MLTFLLNILSIVTGQLGKGIDPLFYDVMIYIYAIVFIISFILVIISIVYFSRKSSKNKKTQPAKIQTTSEDTQFWTCPNCGRDIQMKDGRQYCSSCKFYLSR